MGLGQCTKLLLDHWLSPLAWKPTFFNVHHELGDANVSVLISDSGWNEMLLSQNFHEVLQAHIRDTTIGLGDERWIWTLSNSGLAKPVSVYQFLFQDNSSVSLLILNPPCSYAFYRRGTPERRGERNFLYCLLPASRESPTHCQRPLSHVYLLREYQFFLKTLPYLVAIFQGKLDLFLLMK